MRRFINDTYWPNTDYKIQCWWCRPRSNEEPAKKEDTADLKLPMIAPRPKIGPADESKPDSTPETKEKEPQEKAANKLDETSDSEGYKSPSKRKVASKHKTSKAE